MIVYKWVDIMNNKFTEQEHLTILEMKKRIRDGVSKALLPIEKRLRSHLIDTCIVTGGCSYSSFCFQEPNDWDLLFKDELSASAFIEWIHNHKEDIMDMVEYNGVVAKGSKVITSNAVTLKNKVQVIDWKWQRQNFDFIHCMPWYDIKEDKYYISIEQYNAIKNKQLILRDRNTYVPDNKRLDKWLGRGFIMNFKLDALV